MKIIGTFIDPKGGEARRVVAELDPSNFVVAKRFVNADPSLYTIKYWAIGPRRTFKDVVARWSTSKEVAATTEDVDFLRSAIAHFDRVRATSKEEEQTSNVRL